MSDKHTEEDLMWAQVEFQDSIRDAVDSAIKKGIVDLEGMMRIINDYGTLRVLERYPGIAAHQDMLEALENLENDDGATMTMSAWKLVKDAIRKARGGEDE